jgi:hypothetical protein
MSSKNMVINRIRVQSFGTNAISLGKLSSMILADSGATYFKNYASKMYGVAVPSGPQLMCSATATAATFDQIMEQSTLASTGVFELSMTEPMVIPYAGRFGVASTMTNAGLSATFCGYMEP